MRVAPVLLLFGLAACEKGSNRPHAAADAGVSATRPAPPAPPGKQPKKSKLELDGIGNGPARLQTDAEARASGNADCPMYIGARTTAAHIVGAHGRLVDAEHGYFWQSETSVKVYGEEPKPIASYRMKDMPRGLMALDADAFYVHDCVPPGCSMPKTGVSLSRVDHAGASTVLASDQDSVVTAEAYDGYLYWITSGPAETGALRRVATKGGTVETLWEGRGMTAMIIDDHDVFASDGVSVVAVARAGGKPRVLVDGLRDVHGLAADQDTVYIAESGDPALTMNPTGSIRSVPRAGGDAKMLAGPLWWPSVITVDDERIYYMLSVQGDVWAIDKATLGAPVMLVPTPPRDAGCFTSQWIRADQYGLRWLRRVEGFARGVWWFMPRATMPSPPDTPVEYWKRAAASGDAGVAPAPDDDDDQNEEPPP
jgi:hypothetical protein